MIEEAKLFLNSYVENIQNHQNIEPENVILAQYLCIIKDKRGSYRIM